MHPRKRGNEKLECVKNAFDGAQRCVSSDDHNAPYDTFCSLAFVRAGQWRALIPAPRPPTPTLPKTSSELSLQ